MRKRALQVGSGAVLGLTVAIMATLPGRVPGFGDGGTEGAPSSSLLPQPFPAPSLDLQDDEGRPWTLSSLKGSVVAIFFGYTNCPDVCPLTLGRLGQIQGQVPQDGPALEVVFVSVDPVRDTPDRLRAFAQALPGRIRPVTGPQESVRAQAEAFGVRAMDRSVDGLPAGDYLVDHTARTFLLDPDGLMVATLPPMSAPEEIRAVLDAVYAAVR